MNTFANPREALDFLIGKLVVEAHREGVPLSVSERELLSFSEAGLTTSAASDNSDILDGKFDQEAFERKIGRLIRLSRSRARQAGTEDSDAWSNAVRSLREEDCYLLTMIEQAAAPKPRISHLPHPWAFAGIILLLSLGPLYVLTILEMKPTWENLQGIHFVTMAAALAIYLLALVFAGRRRTRDWLNRLLGFFFGRVN